MEIASAGATANQPALSVSSEPAGETSSPSEQSALELPPGGGESTTSPKAVETETPQASSAANDQSNQQAAGQTTPSEKSVAGTAGAQASSSSISGMSSRRMWLVGGLLLVAMLLLALAIVPALRRYTFTVPGYSRPGPDAGASVFKPSVAPAQKGSAQGNGFVGGPRQVSVQLKAWKPSLRHTALPSGKLGGAFDRLKDLKGKASRTSTYHEPDRESAPLAAPVFESSVGPVVEQAAQALQPAISQAAETVTASATSESAEVSAIAPHEPSQISEDGEQVAFSTQEANEVFGTAEETVFPSGEPSEQTLEGAEVSWAAEEASTEFPIEPIGQEQPPELVSAASQFPISEATTESVSDFPSAISTEAVFPQITTPATMPETTQTPTAPISKAPAPPVAKPQPPPATMQTSVQLTLSFEITAMQLTPSFKMGVLKVRPISKLVTMRLPSPQRAQSALNLQVAFEIVKIQPVAGALGTIRVVPSQQQRPTLGGMPSFAVAGLQVVPNSETAPVQLTPSPQGRASVLITVPFQISTLEFSPSLEIASVILNSNSKQVVVQLPGAGPGPAEGAPMFEIANLELNESGEIAMVQLNLLGGPKRA
jgi:hypothetical protein